MAYAPQRSLTGELDEGLTDGAWKKVVRDRGGIPEYATAAARRDLADTWYGIHEDREKVRPDTGIVTTPNYTPTRPMVYPGG